MSLPQNDRSPDTTHLYAWLSRDADGVEGIIAAPIDGMIWPLVVTSPERAALLRQFAETAAALRGFPAVLVRFERGEEIDRIREAT